MSDAEREAASPMSGEGPGSEDSMHPAVPYLAMIALAFVIGLAVGVYLWFYRGEIIEILTQAPT